MSLFTDLLEFLGLGGIEGLDVVFAGMAIIGTLLFVVYFGLVLIGGVADGALDMVGLDVDFGMDSAEGSFQMLTVQGILSFVMMFGIFGLATSQADQHNIIAVGVGGVAGVISMWLVGKVFQVMMSLESDGTVRHNDAIGAKGTVYRTIRAGKSGQIQVEFQDALRTCEAVAEDEELTIETGKFVTVVGNIAEMLIVRPLSVSSGVAEEE